MDYNTKWISVKSVLAIITFLSTGTCAQPDCHGDDVLTSDILNNVFSPIVISKTDQTEERTTRVLHNSNADLEVEIGDEIWLSRENNETFYFKNLLLEVKGIQQFTVHLRHEGSEQIFIVAQPRTPGRWEQIGFRGDTVPLPPLVAIVITFDARQGQQAMFIRNILLEGCSANATTSALAPPTRPETTTAVIGSPTTLEPDVTTTLVPVIPTTTPCPLCPNSREIDELADFRLTKQPTKIVGSQDFTDVFQENTVTIDTTGKARFEVKPNSGLDINITTVHIRMSGVVKVVLNYRMTTTSKKKTTFKRDGIDNEEFQFSLDPPDGSIQYLRVTFKGQSGADTLQVHSVTIHGCVT